jgi:hypothetical protein
MTLARPTFLVKLKVKIAYQTKLFRQGSNVKYTKINKQKKEKRQTKGCSSGFIPPPPPPTLSKLNRLDH